jgi:arginyl-tRNA synthetase
VDPENPLSKAFYNGDYIRTLRMNFWRARRCNADDRSFTASGDVDDLESIRNFAVAYLRREQDKDLQAFNLKFDEYYLESSLYTSGRVDQTVGKLVPMARPMTRMAPCGSSPPTTAMTRTASCASRTAATPTLCRMWPTTSPSGSAASPRWSTSRAPTTTAPLPAFAPGCRRLMLAFQRGYPDYVLHTMVRVVKGGEEVKISKRAGSYVTLRDLIEWTSKDAVRFFLLSRKPDTEYTFDVDLAVAKNNDNPVYYVQYAHARICSVLAAGVAMPAACRMWI